MGKIFVTAIREFDPDEVDGVESFASVPWLGADYFYLYPDFQRLEQQTGELIDPQKNAFFIGPDMDALEELLAACRSRTASQPASWQQRVGTSWPTRDILYEQAYRARILEFLDDLQRAIATARESGKGVLFYGE